MKIYVASSWRNVWQPGVVRLLRAARHEVYDFKNPPDATGFRWSELDVNWKHWTPAQYAKALDSELAEKGFASDMTALTTCHACVLVLPSGTSSHLELGWAAGAGKKTVILRPFGVEVALGDAMGHSMSELVGCNACDDDEGCWMPRRLQRIEPELMVKMADHMMFHASELKRWAEQGF